MQNLHTSKLAKDILDEHYNWIVNNFHQR